MPAFAGSADNAIADRHVAEVPIPDIRGLRSECVDLEANDRLEPF